jgi:hypothetical protein
VELVVRLRPHGLEEAVRLVRQEMPVRQDLLELEQLQVAQDLQLLRHGQARLAVQVVRAE